MRKPYKHENQAVWLKAKARNPGVKRKPGLSGGFLAVVMWPLRELDGDPTPEHFLAELERRSGEEDWQNMGRRIAPGDVVVVALRSHTVYEDKGKLVLEPIDMKKKEVSAELCKLLTSRT